MPKVKLKDVELYYKKKGNGPPLVLLHGLVMDSSLYSRMINNLSKKHTVYAVDLPMKGNSSNPSRYFNLYDLANSIVDLFAELKIKKPVIIGTSAGAAIAILIASKNKAKKLTLVSPAGLKYFESIFHLMKKMLIEVPIYAVIDNPILYFHFFFVAAKNSFRNLFNKNFWRLLTEDINHSLDKELKKIKCPVEILWTKNDEIIPFRYSKRFLELIPHATLKIPKGHHNWSILIKKEIDKYF